MLDKKICLHHIGTYTNSVNTNNSLVFFNLQDQYSLSRCTVIFNKHSVVYAAYTYPWNSSNWSERRLNLGWCLPLKSVLTLTMCFAATSGCSKPRQHFAALSEVRASQTPSEAIMSLPPAFDSCTSKSGYRTSSAEPCHKLMNLAGREVTAEEKKSPAYSYRLYSVLLWDPDGLEQDNLI